MCLKLHVIEATKYVAHILRKLNSKLTFEKIHLRDNNRLKLKNIHLEFFADNQQALALYNKLRFQITEKMLCFLVITSESFVRWTNVFGITSPEKSLQSQREVYRMVLSHEQLYT
jgi:hypothetical protein